MKMRAVTFTQFGEPNVLTLSDIPQPTPLAEQLLVRVKATALNRADLLQRRGKYAPPAGEPTTMGLEIAGDVVAIGSAVTQHAIGDRVFGLVGGGGYAEYCVIDQGTAMPIPSSLSYIEAAAIPEAFLTANEAIFTLGECQKNQTLLLHAGGSGISTAGIQLAHHCGASVFVTYGSPDKQSKIAAFKPEAMIPYKETSFADAIQTLTNHRGVDVIVDFIGASALENNLSSLAEGGRLICVGLMGGRTSEINLDLILKRRLQIKGLIMRTRSLADKRAMTTAFCKNWLPALAKQEIKPVIDSVFLFSDVKKAHERMENNLNVGKIILQID